MSWIKGLFGVGKAIQQFDDSGAVLDTDNAGNLVSEWNSLRSRYDKLNENWDPLKSAELAELGRKMRLIEHGCVMRHLSATQSADIAAPDRLNGDIRQAVKRYDDDALISLAARIVRRAGGDYRELAQIVIKKHPDLSDRDKREVGLLIWRAISAFYETSVIKNLGGADNIYIRSSIRHTMSGIQASWIESQGLDVDRGEVHGRNTEFAEYQSIGDAMTGNPAPLAGLLDAMLMGTSSSVEIGKTIAQSFADFAARNHGRAAQVLSGTMPG